MYKELVHIPSDIGIIIDMQYSKLKMEYAIEECLVKENVLKKLLEAKKYLPENLTFKIWDAYRPLELQKELYNQYRDQIINDFGLEKMTKEEQNKIIHRYISYPTAQSAHVTGCAIDLTLVDIKTGKDLDMGCSFDCFSKEARTAYFEQEGKDQTIRNNRRILYNAMIKVGFTNLPSEFWHFDYGNSNWHYYKKVGEKNG